LDPLALLLEELLVFEENRACCVDGAGSSSEGHWVALICVVVLGFTGRGGVEVANVTMLLKQTKGRKKNVLERGGRGGPLRITVITLYINTRGEQ